MSTLADNFDFIFSSHIGLNVKKLSFSFPEKSLMLDYFLAKVNSLYYRGIEQICELFNVKYCEYTTEVHLNCVEIIYKFHNRKEAPAIGQSNPYDLASPLHPYEPLKYIYPKVGFFTL